MFSPNRLLVLSAVLLLLIAVVVVVFYQQRQPTSHDWPMWRYDANRSAASPQQLPEQLHLQWVREYPQLEPTWDDPLNRDLMQFDRCYEPVVLGNTLLIGSNASDSLRALDTETGEERWSYYTDGPVRLPPVAANGKVYFVSDDGSLYCLDAHLGTLVWRFRAYPTERHVLGNERLIATWPARGGPVLTDGVIYFGSGIWPFMGVFVYALDAETGQVVWSNDSTGSKYMKQPHNSPSYAGVAPQGAFVVSGDHLLVPCGRSVPACFDRHTGEFKYYHLSRYNKTGGAFVSAVGNQFVNYHRDKVTSLYEVSTGDLLLPRIGNMPVMTPDAMFCMGDQITAFDLANLRQETYEKKVKDKETEEIKVTEAKKWVLDQLWQANVDASGDLIRAGDRLYAGGEGTIAAIDIPASGRPATVSWETQIDGTVGRLIAGNRRLFAVTLDGRIYAFAGKKTQPTLYPRSTTKPHLPEQKAIQARTILQSTGVRDGYCLLYGLDTGEMAEALTRQSGLRVIAIDTDAEKVDRLRRRWSVAGIDGKMLSAQVGEPLDFSVPPYLASLTLLEPMVEHWDENHTGMVLKKLYRSVRPYGGVLCLRIGTEARAQIRTWAEGLNLPQAKIEEKEDLLIIRREGALPGSGDWTHQYGDVANTVKSDDELVKLPLGLLWFGGSSNMDVLPRHGHGPPEQVIGGRLFIEGMDSLSARDVYTGRVLWQRDNLELGNDGVFFDDTYKDTPLSPAYNQVHIAGANSRGTNFVATQDKIYIVGKKGCLVLDPATGKTLDEFALPTPAGADEPTKWGYIGVYEDTLIAGAGIVNHGELLEPDPKARKKLSVWLDLDTNSSKEIVVMDRYTGKIRWRSRSRLGFIHNGITVGNGKLFCLDRMPLPVMEAVEKRGMTIPYEPRILAFDLDSGRIPWKEDSNIFGTWLSYSEEHDILLQAGRPSRDMTRGEPREGFTTYRGRDGRLIWSQWRSDLSYGGPSILHGDTIITDRYAYNLLTGGRKMRTDPFTGEPTPWEFKRNYGCNYAIASENLLTFRSAAAGFFDLLNDGGTGNIGGFKSGCTSNLVVANGVLNAPDYTRTCSCSYQNQTSLALVHDPDVEVWTDYAGQIGEGPVQRLGINLGAPGDRRSETGTVWLEYPRVGGPSPDIAVEILPEEAKSFTHHVSHMEGDGLKWVAASGMEGVSSVTVSLVKPKPEETAAPADGSAAETSIIETTPVDQPPVEERDYRVWLYFAETNGHGQGERVFDVMLQGQTVLTNFDIVKEAGGHQRLIVKEFAGIRAAEDLTVAFAPVSQAEGSKAVLCGIELIAEGE